MTIVTSGLDIVRRIGFNPFAHHLFGVDLMNLFERFPSVIEWHEHQAELSRRLFMAINRLASRHLLNLDGSGDNTNTRIFVEEMALLGMRFERRLSTMSLYRGLDEEFALTITAHDLEDAGL